MDSGRMFGRGLSFPPRVDAAGRMVWSQGEENVRESIRVILSTSPRERLMRPDFGAGLDRFLYEPNTVATWHRIEETIRDALTQWEPRISVDSVKVEPESDATVTVTLAYKLVANRARERMTLTLSVGR